MTKTFPNVTNVTSYVWGNDLSGTPQGAGGVGGLCAVTKDGVPYYPCYDANGNVTEYVNGNSGSTASYYRYDAYGNAIIRNNLTFAHQFATKYFDGETWLSYYGRRYYDPDYRCWLSQDPIWRGYTGLLVPWSPWGSGSFNSYGIKTYFKPGQQGTKK